MVEIIVKKSKESEYAKGFNLKVDDVFSDEVKKEILINILIGIRL